MRLSHNLASLNAFRNYSKVLREQSTALDKITSGYKVRRSKDDPNVMAQSEKTKIQIRGLQVASRNAQDGVSMLQTAEGGLENIGNMLMRIKELTIQAANGTNNLDDQEVVQNEINELIAGIETTAKGTEFNGVKLLSQGYKFSNQADVMTKPVPIGANVGDLEDIPFYNLTTEGLDIKGKINVTDASKLGESLDAVNNAIETVLSVRSEYGSLENRFEECMNNVGEISLKMEGANSELVDADVAEEMMIYAKSDILYQSSLAIMRQTNNFPMDVLKILENVKSK
ncbi:flagellin [Clostridium botulinum]|uniref:flagellin n=1 Tax=Clostridium botulinum TaxID=1491 RepID=UPI0013758156|nr:flagellin [Clostridium botulinum]MCC5418871.1 flagellin [Clostridium botulinum]NCI21388.1 flagellin [Clostridium botulinum]NCI37607.1 flagellin [Clostridium botulinum]NCI75210.1 flagellin [Clostridium botulinum]NDI40380.1 flagellin [Clostridium botulinum]